MLSDDLCGELTFERGVPLDPFLDESVVRMQNFAVFL